MLTPTCVLLSGSAISYRKAKTWATLLQLVGAGFLVIVGVCHIFEGVGLLPQIGWGLEYSLGHYIDFWSAALGLILFPAGYLCDALSRRRP
jgi:hypothetical protein